MNTHAPTAAAMAASILTIAASPVWAADPTVEELLADHALLRKELDRCTDLGMKAVDDPRCKTADEAERRRFFTKPKYTPQDVQVYPGAPVPDVKAPEPPKTEPPHG